MRGGAQLHCVVNGAAGQERRFESARPPANERIAVIGAGPAGLTYASLVARGNSVTVFERAERAGGAFRYAGKAPLFQDVVANQEFVRSLRAPARRRRVRGKGVTFRYGVDVTRWPELLQPFDRIVIATGAAYRFGLGPVATALLDRGAGRWPLVRQVLSVATRPRLVLPPGPRADGRGAAGPGAPRPEGGRDRRRARGRKEPPGHFQRLRSRVKSLIAVKDLKTFWRTISHNLDAGSLMLAPQITVDRGQCSAARFG